MNHTQKMTAALSVVLMFSSFSASAGFRDWEWKKNSTVLLWQASKLVPTVVGLGLYHCWTTKKAKASAQPAATEPIVQLSDEVSKKYLAESGEKLQLSDAQLTRVLERSSAIRETVTQVVGTKVDAAMNKPVFAKNYFAKGFANFLSTPENRDVIAATVFSNDNFQESYDGGLVSLKQYSTTKVEQFVKHNS